MLGALIASMSIQLQHYCSQQMLVPLTWFSIFRGFAFATLSTSCRTYIEAEDGKKVCARELVPVVWVEDEAPEADLDKVPGEVPKQRSGRRGGTKRGSGSRVTNALN